jgi:hypothetical protein
MMLAADLRQGRLGLIAGGDQSNSAAVWASLPRSDAGACGRDG